MAILKAKKKEILQTLGTALKSAASIVFVNFHGLNVSDTTLLRKGLRDNGVGYYVSKKTLLKKALEEGKYEGAIPEMAGEIALAYGKDETAAAREVFNFQKKFKEKLAIVGGIFEGKFLDASAMTKIASIPSKEVLYGQLLGLFTSPVRGFAAALSEIAKKKA
jgi:large subunit ribosomal protein L10